MTETINIIYGGIGAIVAIAGVFWHFHRRSLDVEKRITKLESADLMLTEQVQYIKDNQGQLSARVERIETTLHQIDKNVIATSVKLEQILELLKARK
ncbi:hypothetical protein [Edwardsiella tarda]|uniref:Uncharacterized protein n=1 Tax=Edwardsiella tarda TaxID=636 RepID=A0A2A7U763_EDWTA|nr:hypothetical protein [Edwardsiella tarda]PEH74124.1 hypothetical protein CRM76_02145 [Edwardsiella tarda]